MSAGDGLQPPRGTADLVNAIGDEVFRKLRVENPPPARTPAVDWIKIAPYVCVFLTIVSGILGVGMWRMIDKISDTSLLAAKNEGAIARIDKERAARIAAADGRFEKLEQRTSPIDAMLKDIGRLETSAAGLDIRLVQGREERLNDTARIVAGQNEQKIELALLRQQLQQIRQMLEARGRKPDDPPFGGGENQMWTPPLIDPDLQPPSTLRATLSRPRAAPRRGGRRAVALASLTRSLERAFGRPHFRGRYWASLSARR